MNEFEALFGVKNNQIKKNCLLLPVLGRGMLADFKVNNLSKGRIYHTANSRELTLIHTGIGSAFVGDAVLYLKETACENVILFGSCGLVNDAKGLSIASLVSPVSCYAQESFSRMLMEKDKHPEIFYADKDLSERFLNYSRSMGVKEALCSTISSFKLEQLMQEAFIQQGIDIVEMECSAFFSAAKFSRLKAVPLFYVTDIINKEPFYNKLELNLKLKLNSAIRKASGIICEFIEENLNV